MLCVVLLANACTYGSKEVVSGDGRAGQNAALTIQLKSEVSITLSGPAAAGEVFRSIPTDISNRLVVKKLSFKPVASISKSIFGHRYAGWKLPEKPGTHYYTLFMDVLLIGPYKHVYRLATPFAKNIDPLGSEPFVDTNDERIREYSMKLRGLSTAEKTSDIVRFVQKAVKYRAADGKWVHTMDSRKSLDVGYGHTGQICSIFAAISRSSGIPTLIMSGYTGDEDRIYFNHWIEIEIRPSEWAVIDIASILAGNDEKIRMSLYYIPVAWRTQDSPQKSAFSLGSVEFGDRVGDSKVSTVLQGYKIE